MSVVGGRHIVLDRSDVPEMRARGGSPRAPRLLLLAALGVGAFVAILGGIVLLSRVGTKAPSSSSDFAVTTGALRADSDDRAAAAVAAPPAPPTPPGRAVSPLPLDAGKASP